MISGYVPLEMKTLLQQFVMEEMNYAKECKKLHELIVLSKKTDEFHQTLTAFLRESLIENFSIQGLIIN
jgi:hypothetical protein